MPLSSERPVEQRLQAALATTIRMVQDLGRLEKANRANNQFHRAHGKRESGKTLTTEEEELLRARTYNSYFEEHQRIQLERGSIAVEVRPALLTDLWSILRDLTYAYPCTRESWQKFRELAQTLPEESLEIPDLDDFVCHLDSLLQEVAQFVPKNAPTTLDPPLEETHVSAPQRLASKRGPDPNMVLHQAVAKATKPFLLQWKQYLDEIAERLDRDKVNIPDSWKKWNPRPRTWSKAVSYERSRVIKRIDYTLGYLAKNLLKL